VDDWCERSGQARGRSLAPATAWQLARAWYHDRLDPRWRRKTRAEAEQVFASVGLAGEFWSLG
jgi:hypothetical protein